MVTIYDVPADALIEEVAARLEDRIDEPDWVEFAKSGAGKELPPEQEDFWYVRSASLLRKVAQNEPIGIERLATEYGSKKRGSNRYSVRPGEHEGGSRKLIRASLQALEEDGLGRPPPARVAGFPTTARPSSPRSPPTSSRTSTGRNSNATRVDR